MEFTTTASFIGAGAWAGFATVAASCDAGCFAAYLIITGRNGDASFLPLIHIDKLHIAVAIDKIGEK